MNKKAVFLAAGLLVSALGLSAQDQPQHIRTPYLPDWGQVPNEELDQHARDYPGTFYLQGPETEKTVALTFDDGPASQTPELLDMLKVKGVKVTFFVIGSSAKGRPQWLRRAFDEGHTIGNHTWDHPYLTKLASPDAWKQELDSTGAQVAKVIGKTPRLFRPPYGFMVPYQIEDLKTRGMKGIAWSVASDDWFHTAKLGEAEAVEATVNQIMAYVHPGAIILMHDGGGKTRRPSMLAAARVIDLLTAQGYRFVTVDQLIQTQPYL